MEPNNSNNNSEESPEHFIQMVVDAIEGATQQLSNGVSTLQGISSGQAKIVDNVDSLKRKISELRSENAEFRSENAELRTEVAELSSKVNALFDEVSRSIMSQLPTDPKGSSTDPSHGEKTEQTRA